MEPDRFVGQVDAHLLTAIQDGLALSLGHDVNAPVGGAHEFERFFSEFRRGAISPTELKRLAINGESASIHAGIQWSTAAASPEERFMLGGADWWRAVGRGVLDEQYGGVSELGIFTPQSRGAANILENYEVTITVGGVLVQVGDGFNAIGTAWNALWN